MALLNAPLALYFGRWHQAGPVAAVWHLADEAATLGAPLPSERQGKEGVLLSPASRHPPLGRF